uniref:Zinc metalloproteinase n=1 Tax=Globodera rostochiensis TaxID=31243 RepID=A0A914IBS8_GLORO
MDDMSPMDISALEQSSHLKRLLGTIQMTALKQHGRFTDKDPTKLNERLALLKKVNGNDGTELTVNRQIADELFEGDILLSREQAQQILRDIENIPPIKRKLTRQINPDPNNFWTDLTIAYTVQSNDAALLQAVQAAQRHISTLTCIRFAFYNDPTVLIGKKDYMEYSRQSGCWSMVGRQGGNQLISIGYGCESLGIVAHETLHALGLWHEQSRTDQEYYVSINYNNILPGTEYNFYKRTPDTSDNLGQPYDLGSVMHYSSKSFASDFNRFTITSLEPAYQQTMGYRVGLSFKDAKMINMRYCSKICAAELACANGGYTNPNNCNRCLCPDGYSGALCDEHPTSESPNCLNTGTLMAGQFPGNISTLSLTPNTNCYWKILPDSTDKRVVVTVKKLEFPCEETCSSYVEVKAKQDKIATGARLCCSIPAIFYADIGTEVLIILNVVDDFDGNYTGFEIEYKTISGSALLDKPPPVPLLNASNTSAASQETINVNTIDAASST